LHPSDYAWAVLIAGVVAWEIFSPPGELLSEAVDRYLVRHPVLTRAAILITAAHLLNALEVRPLQWIDIYAHIARIGNR
jgi:hypothetical protein